MKAAGSTPNGLELRDIAEPVPKPNEVKVRVRACGLNRADLSAARSFPPSPPADTAGRR